MFGTLVILVFPPSQLPAKGNSQAYFKKVVLNIFQIPVCAYKIKSWVNEKIKR